MIFFLEKVGISIALVDGQNVCHVSCFLRCSAVQFIELIGAYETNATYGPLEHH